MLYTNKQDSLGNETQPEPVHQFVHELSRDLVHMNHTLYFDRLVPGIPLIRDLLANGIYACGNLRLKKKVSYFPKTIPTF